MDGRLHYVVVLPREDVCLEVVWCLVSPLSVGSNVDAPHAFVSRGAFADARPMHGWESGENSIVAERISIPAAWARQIVDLTSREDIEPTERRRWADRFFHLGLLPNLWSLDLTSFGQ